jgi:hypothetical protein
MVDSAVVVKTRKFKKNPLLSRKQVCVCVPRDVEQISFVVSPQRRPVAFVGDPDGGAGAWGFLPRRLLRKRLSKGHL